MRVQGNENKNTLSLKTGYLGLAKKEAGIPFGLANCLEFFKLNDDPSGFRI